MHFVHCNNCYVIRDDDPKIIFYISLCSHILCKNCVKQVCVICKRPFKPTAISKNMPASLAIYFENPMKLFERFQKVVQFQYKQEDSLANYYVNIAPAEHTKLKAEYDSLVKLETKMAAYLENEKVRSQKIKRYIEYHETRSQNNANFKPPIQRNAKSLHNLTIFDTNSSPCTPTLSSTNGTGPTVVNNDNNNDNDGDDGQNGSLNAIMSFSKPTKKFKM